MKMVYSVPINEEGIEASFDAREVSPQDAIYVVAELCPDHQIHHPFRTAIPQEAILRGDGGTAFAIDPITFFNDFCAWLDTVGPRGALRILKIEGGVAGKGLRAGYVFSYPDEATYHPNGELNLEATRFRFALLIEPLALTAPGAPPGALQ